MLEAKEFDRVLLDDGVEADVLENYSNGDLLLEKEIPSNSKYPDYEQVASNNSHVVKVTYHPESIT